MWGVLSCKEQAEKRPPPHKELVSSLYAGDPFNSLCGHCLCAFFAPLKNCLQFLFALSLPQTAPRIPISWKRGFRGPKSPFFYKRTHRKWGFFGRKLPFPACVRATGNGGFRAPKPSFPGNGNSGPCLGSG